MKVFDAGSGTPIVLVPGIQGRWEWMRPAVEALSRRARVITFSLADEPSCGSAFDERNGFACFVDQIGTAMDAAGVDRAVVCGVSYGGLIAAAFAARHVQRVEALVLVSAIPPTWRPDGRVRFFLRAPRLLSPLFLLSSLRLCREIVAASRGPWHALTMAAQHAARVLAHMTSPRRMARRVRLLEGANVLGQLRALQVPTLVVTGEAALDRIVPVEATREYLRLWPRARAATLSRTGHLGVVTKPEALADLIVTFAHQASNGNGGAVRKPPLEEPPNAECRHVS